MQIDQFDTFIKIEDTTWIEYKDVILKRIKYGTSAYQDLDPLTAAAIELHLNDKSTGSLRELGAIWLSDAEPYIPKDGRPAYDAIRDGKYIECKPITTSFSSKKNKTASGKGSINDHSLSRHNRFLDDGLIMQTSQFFEGCCGWIIEFPYADIEEIMYEQIRTASGRCVARFSFRDWCDKNTEIKYINPELIERHRIKISGGGYKEPKEPWLYHWLVEKSDA